MSEILLAGLQETTLQKIKIVGAAPGPVGTARVQYHLRQVLVFMNSFTLNKPEVFINHSSQKFNAQGDLTDPQTAQYIREQLLALQRLAQRVKGRCSQ